jgi:hypothetical protein
MKACNCYAEVTEKLAAHMAQGLPEGAEGLEVKLGGFVFGISSDSGLTHRAACPVVVSYLTPKKASGLKHVRKTISMRASFCPFCGVAYDPPAAKASGV